MIPVVSVATMRESDAATVRGGIPSRELMRRAGEAVFQSYPWQDDVAILCGSGNNAGDGYVLAGLLQRAGIKCRLLLLEEKFSPDGRYYFEACCNAGVPWSVFDGNAPDFSGDSVLVDCIFGTGFYGNAEGGAAAIITAANASGLPIVSVDINSGMNGDSGRGEPCIRSVLTVSIGMYKPGHFLGNAKDVIGKLTNADIGISAVEGGEVLSLAEVGDLKAVIRPRRRCVHKGDFGYVGLMGGCREYSGAAKLANLSCAALRSGCGVATLIVPGSLADGVAPYLLESTLALLPDQNGHMCFDAEAIDRITARLAALAVGMGWGRSPENAKILSHLLQNYKGKLIIDADGLNTLAEMDKELLRSASGRLLLTPHYKEFERISGYSMQELLQAPVRCAVDFAKQYGLCLLLKGPTTVVTDGMTTYLVDRGCGGMATAGSGDVLSGILAGLLGYVDCTPMTAASGAYLAGLAGELAEEELTSVSMLASDTVKYLPQAIRAILEA